MSDIDKINEAAQEYAEKKHNHNYNQYYSPIEYATINDFTEGAIWYRDNMINFYNEGVEACIESIKGNPFVANHGYLDEIISELEQLKKQIQ